MKKHINIPIFVPHMGCPNDCVFCNQRQISGHTEFNVEAAKREIAEILAAVPADTSKEIAFFGGSFTGIDRELFLGLCALGKKYVDEGGVDGLRCSTRPDYIDAEVLEILKAHGFHTVELGVQSIDDNVLLACRRGHTAKDTEHACALVKKSGLSLVCQMMIGLPSATVESEIKTARFIAETGAEAVRVYPTVVFPKTELLSMCGREEYTPLSVEEATERTANVLEIFDGCGIKVIRVGLCESEGLRTACAGPNVADMGERAMSRVFLRRAERALDGVITEGGELTLLVGERQTSKMCGHKRENLQKIKEKFKLKTVKVIEKNDIIGYNIKVKVLFN